MSKVRRKKCSQKIAAFFSKTTINRIRSRFQRGDVFSEDSESPYVLSLAQRRSGSAQRTPITPDVRLYHRAVVVAQEATGAEKLKIALFGVVRRTTNAKLELRRGGRPKNSLSPNPIAANFLKTTSGSLRGMVRQLSIDQFENESRRVSMGTDSISKALPSPMFERNSNEPCVSKVSLRSFFCRAGALRSINLHLNNACAAFPVAHNHRNTQKHAARPPRTAPPADLEAVRGPFVPALGGTDQPAV